MTDTGRVHVETRGDWRAWLEKHHATNRSVWVVSWKKRTGRPAVPYADLVSEALAFGWIDSKPAALDEARTMLYLSPRRRGSAWSRPNKVRVEALEDAGLMREPGRRMVEAAKADGSWTVLDEVEDLVVPPDLADAFARHPGSASTWETFPPSTRRGILEWIVQARTAPTRDTRTGETAALAARGERAAQWRPKPTSNHIGTHPSAETDHSTEHSTEDNIDQAPQEPA